MALERLEVATQWWEALRRLGATVPTEAWWLGVGFWEEPFAQVDWAGWVGRLFWFKGAVIWFSLWFFQRLYRDGVENGE